MGKFHFFSICPFRDAIVKLSLFTENWLQVKHEAFFVINYCNCTHTVLIKIFIAKYYVLLPVM